MDHSLKFSQQKKKNKLFYAYNFQQHKDKEKKTLSTNLKTMKMHVLLKELRIIRDQRGGQIRYFMYWQIVRNSISYALLTYIAMLLATRLRIVYDIYFYHLICEFMTRTDSFLLRCSTHSFSYSSRYRLNLFEFSKLFFIRKNQSIDSKQMTVL